MELFKLCFRSKIEFVQINDFKKLVYFPVAHRKIKRKVKKWIEMAPDTREIFSCRPFKQAFLTTGWQIASNWIVARNAKLVTSK